MPKGKVTGRLDGGDFTGKTKTFTVLPGGRPWPTCKVCGSTIYPSRRESRKVRVIDGKRMRVDTYRCACRTGYEDRREAAAA